MLQQHRVGIATALACLAVAAFAYINAMPVRLTGDEESAATATFRDQYIYLFDLKAKKSIFHPDLLSVTFKGQVSHDQWPEWVEVRYERTSQTVAATRRLTGWDTLLMWGLNLTTICALAVVGGLYVTPLLAGHHCPNCRKAGVFLTLLEPHEKELYPAIWASDGGLWPPILETEWTCPSCGFHEYSVRRPAQQGDDANILKRMFFSLSTASAEVNPYISSDQMARLTSRIVEEMTQRAITRAEYERRWDEAQRSARERSDRRG